MNDRNNDKTLAKPDFFTLTESLPMSKKAREAIRAAYAKGVRDARDEAEKASTPENAVQAVKDAASYGFRTGYYAAIRDVASEQQKFGGDAEHAARDAMKAEWDAQLAAPSFLLSQTTVGTAQDEERVMSELMKPRQENRARMFGPEPLAKMAEIARDKAKAEAAMKAMAELEDSGIIVKDVG